MSRVLDVVVGVVGLIWLAPLLACAALLVMLDGMGPVFERRSCLGPDGRRATLLRFRTTAFATSPAAASLMAASRSRIGHLLWVTRIADLPVLVSMVRGDFSLFGAPEAALAMIDGRDWRPGEAEPLHDLAAVPLGPGDQGGAAGTPAA